MTGLLVTKQNNKSSNVMGLTALSLISGVYKDSTIWANKNLTQAVMVIDCGEEPKLDQLITTN